MFSSIDKLSKTTDERDFYRLFFIILCFLNLAFHYLFLYYVPQSIDPLWIRGFGSICCLLTVGISFFDDKRVYDVNAYFSLILFLLINNCYLLGVNNFIGEYFLGSVASILIVSFFCRNIYEYVVFSALCLAAFAGGFAFKNVYIEVPILAGVVVLFILLAGVLFVFRQSFVMRNAAIILNVKNQKTTIEQTADILAKTVSNLQNLLTANTNIVLAYDTDGICKDIWYPKREPLEKELVSQIGTNLTGLGIPQLTSYFKTALKTLKTVSFEFDSFFGNDRWYGVTITPVLDRQDQWHNGNIIVVLTDVTDVKVNAAKVRENELILYNEQVVARIGSWWTDVGGSDIYWSNNLFSILEVADIPADRSKLNYYISLVHPDDRERAQHFFSSLANNPLNELEHRSITPKGNIKYFKVVSGYPVKDDKGKVVKIAGIVQDVTDNKIAHKMIRQSQAELIEVQAIAKIGGWKWDILLNDIEWSDEIYSIYEFDKDEVKREDHFKLLMSIVHPADKTMLAGSFKNPLKLTRAVVEYRIITKSGKLKHITLIIGKTLKKDGAIKKIIGTMQDMTERKKIEFDLKGPKISIKMYSKLLTLPL